MPNRMHHRPQARLPTQPRRKVPPDLRKRAVKACNECNVRKVKCSGIWPCTLCASNNRTCVFPAVIEKVSVPQAELEELKNKVAMYEQLLPNGFLDYERLQSLLQPGAKSQASPSLSSRTSQLAIDETITKAEPSKDHNGAEPVQLFEDSDGIGRYLGETSGTVFLDHLKARIGVAIVMAEQDQRALANDEPPAKLGIDSVYDVSEPKHLAVNPFWLPSDETLSAGMAELRYLIQDGLGHWPSGGFWWWGDLLTLPARPSLSMMPAGDAIEYRYLAFCNAAMALVCETTSFWRPQESQKHSELTTAEHYYARAVVLIGSPLNMKGRTIADVATMGIMCLYLIEVHAQDTAYMCISAAIHLSIALGAHKICADEGSKRIFWSVFTLDRWLSCLMGRPQAISDADIQLPLPVDIPSMPPAAGLRANIELSRISGHVVQSLNHKAEPIGDNGEPDKTVQKLDSWRASLSPALQLSADGLSDDAAACLLHMRSNQLLIVAIRPFFYSAMEANATASRIGRVPTERLKNCVAAGRRNLQLGNHVMMLVDRRLLIHPINHFIFNAGICVALGNLVLFHDMSPEQVEARNRDVDFAIDRLTESYGSEADEPGSLALILRELKALIEKVTISPLLSDSAAEISLQAQAIPPGQFPEAMQSPGQFPAQMGESSSLYDELRWWMDYNWSMYDAAYMGE
ncbi:hypothetical protein QQS21_009900 [Conoideocrella luteorostrata]|uniref:Zn(2)-C6 fungal-type domain-containing protein n=1 Tax=Conoideocrella luteorostrata TaxID=1105319 RepID=A0AAJ0CIS1_9HYPO|nr:hypothetical protein QQS21_009900 [Conoideocrella luteorostrata]